MNWKPLSERLSKPLKFVVALLAVLWGLLDLIGKLAGVTVDLGPAWDQWKPKVLTVTSLAPDIPTVIAITLTLVALALLIPTKWLPDLWERWLRGRIGPRIGENKSSFTDGKTAGQAHPTAVPRGHVVASRPSVTVDFERSIGCVARAGSLTCVIFPSITVQNRNETEPVLLEFRLYVPGPPTAGAPHVLFQGRRSLPKMLIDRLVERTVADDAALASPLPLGPSGIATGHLWFEADDLEHLKAINYREPVTVQWFVVYEPMAKVRLGESAQYLSPHELLGAPLVEDEPLRSRRELVVSWRAMIAEIEGVLSEKGGDALARLRQHRDYYGLRAHLSPELKKRLDNMGLEQQLADSMRRSIGLSSAVLGIIEDDINRLAREWGVD